MRIVKIAPGKRAKYWGNNDCLENKHICVGWGKVGDLRKYSSEGQLRAAVNRYQYHGRSPGTASNTAWQLWTLRNLSSGDKVIANKGNSIVLRVGTVTGPYLWNAKHHHHHTVPVAWGTVMCVEEHENGNCHQIVTQTGAKQAKKQRTEEKWKTCYLTAGKGI